MSARIIIIIAILIELSGCASFQRDYDIHDCMDICFGPKNNLVERHICGCG